MNEGAFVIVTHGFNNSSYKWRRSIGKKEEIIFYDLIILHSIAFTTEKVVFMNHSEQYWKPKETKKVHNFFCRLNLRFLTRKVWDKNVCFYDDVFVIQNTTLKFFIWVKIVSNIVSKKKKLASLKSANVICLPSTMNRSSVFPTIDCNSW